MEATITDSLQHPDGYLIFDPAVHQRYLWANVIHIILTDIIISRCFLLVISAIIEIRQIRAVTASTNTIAADYPFNPFYSYLFFYENNYIFSNRLIGLCVFK